MRRGGTEAADRRLGQLAWDEMLPLLRALAVFNALHWIDPDVRYAKPAAILAPEGAMVVGSCRCLLESRSVTSGLPRAS
jgi:hypothetical protein